MAKDIVSILCPSYNHEKYVVFFIKSLLAQTNPNWELIIVDDCSTDNNVAEIKKFSDNRIKLIQNPFNMGLNCGLNVAFEKSSGKYISYYGSDDMFMPDYIENVFRCFEKNKTAGVLYCNLQCIDNDNNFKGQYYLSVKNRYDALHWLFMNDNCLFSPGMVVKRDLLKSIMPLDIPMSQYQDYKMHIDLLLQSDFMVMDKISVLYRKNDLQSGLSAFNEITTRRRNLEENLLMDSFLKIKNVSLLRNIFPTELESFGKITTDVIPFVLGMLAMESSVEYKKIWGYNQISKYINNSDNYALVNKLYDFSYKDFLGLAKKFDNSNANNLCRARNKYKKYKKLFNISCVVIIVLVIVMILIKVKNV